MGCVSLKHKINGIVFGLSLDDYDFGIEVDEHCVAVLHHAEKIIHPFTSILYNFMCFTTDALIRVGVPPSNIYKYFEPVGWKKF